MLKKKTKGKSKRKTPAPRPLAKPYFVYGIEGPAGVMWS